MYIDYILPTDSKQHFNFFIADARRHLDPFRKMFKHQKTLD